jgi:excisionase family DNA binding protein
MATKRTTRRLDWDPRRPLSERDGALLYTRKEVADVLGTTERHVRRMIEAHTLPVTKIGGKVRIHKDDLAAYIKAQRVPPKRVTKRAPKKKGGR